MRNPDIHFVRHFLLFILPALLLFMSSCHVDRRIHRRGFHIEWTGSKKRMVDNVVQSGKPAVTENQARTDPHDGTLLLMSPRPFMRDTTVMLPAHTIKPVRISKPGPPPTLSPERVCMDSGTEDGGDGEYVKRNHPLGVAGFILGLASGGLVFINPYAAIFIATTAGILSFIARSEVRRRPDLFRNRWMTVAGIVSALAAIGLLIILTIQLH